MQSIEEYCGDLEDFLEDNDEVEVGCLACVASGVSIYAERLARAIKASKNASNRMIRPIWEKLFFLSRWVLKHPESVADEEVRDTILFAVAQVYQAMEWELI